MVTGTIRDDLEVRGIGHPYENARIWASLELLPQNPSEFRERWSTIHNRFAVLRDDGVRSTTAEASWGGKPRPSGRGG